MLNLARDPVNIHRARARAKYRLHRMDTHTALFRISVFDLRDSSRDEVGGVLGLWVLFVCVGMFRCGSRSGRLSVSSTVRVRART